MIFIKARRVEMEEGKASTSQDLLSHLLTSSDENGRYLTENDIANNILVLLFAGHDTSAVSITLLLKSLGEHPNVYDKVLKVFPQTRSAKQFSTPIERDRERFSGFPNKICKTNFKTH
ncbi:putative cytochrome P450 [Helianthus debilis subsp. tardiflorus]